MPHPRRAQERLARAEEQMAYLVAVQRETRDQLVHHLIDRGLNDQIIARQIALCAPDIAAIRVSLNEAVS